MTIKVLDALPFVTEVNPQYKDFHEIYAVVCDNLTRISIFNITNETFIPPIVFCWKFLQIFSIKNSKFRQNGTNINSDGQISSDISRLAETLTELSYIWYSNYSSTNIFW